MKLSRLLLGIKSPEKTLDYYIRQLGMRLLETKTFEGKSRYVLSFPDNVNTVSLELHHDILNNEEDEVYEETGYDNYWKYSLFVDNIEEVYRSLNPKFVKGVPFQFKDIGYLMHTRDTENYSIEYIQKFFKNNSTPTTTIESLPLKEIPVFGLITLRTKDPLKSIKFYEHLFELKLLVRMYVDHGNGRGFTLYFLGSKHLQPPNELDLDAIENREWMYQQKESFIELQYYWGSEQDFNLEYTDRSDKAVGLKGIVFETSDLNDVILKLRRSNISTTKQEEEISQEKILFLRSPDNQKIIIREARD
ncbi:hypothetical protein [Tenacibaculum sp. C7A-26P2]|uniref:hypothetical protein n=1 Tax=Tenacibaculum sp. C7A-26P2 TaxID=3447504 RepID=UPI003F83CE30